MKKVIPQKPCLMGILNMTPDSFSDGGLYYQRLDEAGDHAAKMVEQGAEIIDVGGESTRPGSAPVPEDEQKRRILGIIEKIAERCPDVNISVDTTLSRVAGAALDAGATMLNDISAGRDDPDMFHLAADRKMPICLMHIQGKPATMQDNPEYKDVVSEVCAFLSERVDTALCAGVSEDRIILDPGIGFGKTSEHNRLLLKNLSRIVELGFPVMIGVSRKSFIGSVCKQADPQQRVIGSCAVTAFGLLSGVRIFRVHDVAEHRQVMDVTRALIA